MDIGRHINTLTLDNFLSAPSYGKELGCDIIQIFLGNPQDVLSKARSKTDLLKFGSELKKYNLKVIIHGHYSVNFCHDYNSSRFRTSIKCLVSDLNSASIIGPNCIGVIIHMGKNVNKYPQTQAINNYVIGLETTLKVTSNLTVPIILETGAGVGTEVGTSLDDLAKIYNQLSDKSRIGFCLDTCHIWSAGYDIGSKKGVEEYLTKFDELIGLDKVMCIHLNNSMCGLGSKKDRHADLLFGEINPIGLSYIVKFAHKYKIPIITETPLGINPENSKEIAFQDELKIILGWIKK